MNIPAGLSFDTRPDVLAAAQALLNAVGSVLPFLFNLLMSIVSEAVWQSVVLVFKTIFIVVLMLRNTARLLFRWIWKKRKRFHRRKLPYHLVMRCRRRLGNRPPWVLVWPRSDFTEKDCFRPPKFFLDDFIDHDFERHERIFEGGGGGCNSEGDEPDLGLDPGENGFKFRYSTRSGRFKLQSDEDKIDGGRFELEIISDELLSKFCSSADFLSTFRLMKSVEGADLEAGARSAVQRYNVLYAANVGTFTGANNHRKMPLIWDSGASYGLTPFHGDFIDYQECHIEVKDISKVNVVKGIGTVMYKFVATNGDLLYLPSLAYHLDSADIRLFSPQTYHQLYGGDSELDGDRVFMQLKKQEDYKTTHAIEIPIDRGQTNLPIVRDVACSKSEIEKYGHHFRSAIKLQDRRLGLTSDWKVGVDDFQYEFKSMSQMMCQCVGTDANANLTNGQKELLLWHWKLGIGMRDVQRLMRGHQAEEPSGKSTWMPPVIKPQFPAASNCSVPKCQSCELARAKRRNPGTVRQEAVKEKLAILSWDRYEAGDYVSMDQFEVGTPGRLETGYGREGDNNRYHGGTIFNDAATGVIWLQNQVSLNAGETILAKEKFEQWLRDLAWVEIKHLHSDNGVFVADEFRQDCELKHQTQSFSGVGAKHQNAKAERAIQTIMWMARTFMLHVSLHWTERGVDNIALWGFAVKHAVWLYNRIPNRVTGLTPLELLTKQKADHRDLLRTQVWGCPAYVLDPSLQDGKKIPKFKRRARMGQFLGFSEEHSSLVSKVRNLQTGFVSPQFHCVYDNKFETVFSSGTDEESMNAIFNELWDTSRDSYAEPEFDESGNLVYSPPPLDDVWLDESERRDRKEKLRQQRIRNEESIRRRAENTPVMEPSPASPPDLSSLPDLHRISDDDSINGDSSDVDAPALESEGGDSWNDQGIVSDNEDPSDPSEGDNSAPEGARSRKRKSNTTQWTRDEKGRLKRTLYADLLAFERNKLSDTEKRQFACSLGTKQVPPTASRQNRKKLKLRQNLARRRELGDLMLNNATTMEDIPTVEDLKDSPLAKFIHLAANDCGYSGSCDELICNWVHPLFLKAKSEASKEDNPNWKQAMNGPFAQEFWEAAKVEIQTLESMGAWEVVERTPDMNVIQSTWAFKIKRYPDGLIKKFKARFCARGDQQIENVDFFNTYSPVVSWTTVRLMLILEILLDLKSKQGDVTAAFLHAELGEDEHVYVDMPLGFRKDGKVLSLKRTLYGLRQSPRAFWSYMVQKFESCGLQQSKFDSCLFVGEKVIAIQYVDDILFWARDEKDIHELAMALRGKGVDLEEEEDAAGYLGVHIEKNKDGLLELTQVGLIDRIIEALGLDVGTVHGKWTPAEAKPLVKDENGEAAHGDFSYSSVVGMLLYLSGHSRPDIAYSVNLAARYMFNPKHSHEKALKRIGRYLKATRNRGLVLNPSDNILKIDSFPDADFAGLYGYESSTDPACVKSRTGFVINVADCPVFWQSKLQSETALSTMEAEIVALAHSCRELFPIIDLVTSMSESVGLPNPQTTLHVSIHEDNAGALILAETLPPQHTPRSKHYHIKTIWFREEIVKRGIKLLKIETAEQLGDIFTKALPKVTFEYLRMKLMGW